MMDRDPSGVGMLIMWGRKEVLGSVGSVGSVRYFQGMGAENIRTRGARLVKIQCRHHVYSINTSTRGRGDF